MLVAQQRMKAQYKVWRVDFEEEEKEKALICKIGFKGTCGRKLVCFSTCDSHGQCAVLINVYIV